MASASLSSAGLKPRARAVRLTSLKAVNRTDWPERKLKDERASNVFLIRLEDLVLEKASPVTGGTLLYR